MKRILVTGAKGFVGKNLIVFQDQRDRRCSPGWGALFNVQFVNCIDNMFHSV